MDANRKPLGVPYFLGVSKDSGFGCKDAKEENGKDPSQWRKRNRMGVHSYIQSSFLSFLSLSI
jgi:hypothetical protein